MKYFEFTDAEKIRMFDSLAKEFYNGNFGHASKADVELIMFDFYIKKMISTYQDTDGRVDYSRISDYRISKELGITQQRVRSLKVRNQLVHPIDFNWEIAFARLIENASYDTSTKRVTLTIPDPNLFIEIENHLEEKGNYIEKQLNSKLLQMRVEYFVELAIDIEPANTRKSIIKKLKEVANKHKKTELEFDEKHIGKALIENTDDIVSLILNISSLFSPQNVLFISISNLIKSVLTV